MARMLASTGTDHGASRMPLAADVSSPGATTWEKAGTARISRSCRGEPEF